MLGHPEALLLDVRTPDEFRTGHFTGARLIPTPMPPLFPEDVAELRRALRRTMGVRPRAVPIVLYCKLGKRSGIAARILREEGFSNVLDLHGIQTDPLFGLIARGGSL